MLWRGKWLHFSLTLPRRFRKKSYITQRVVPDFQRFPWTQFKAGLCTSGLFKPKDRSNFCTTVDNKSIIPLDDDAVNSYLRIQRTERPWRTSRLVKSRFFVVFFFPPPPPAFLAYRRAYRPPWSYLFLSGREIGWITRGYPPLLGRYCILVVGCQMKPTKPVVLRIYRVFAAMFWLVFYVWRECCAVRGSASRRRPGSRGAPFSPPLFRQNDREREGGVSSSSSSLFHPSLSFANSFHPSFNGCCCCCC